MKVAENGRKAAGRNMVSACFLCYIIDRSQAEWREIQRGPGKSVDSKRRKAL